jgi:hypothetical protein
MSPQGHLLGPDASTVLLGFEGRELSDSPKLSSARLNRQQQLVP